MYMSNEVNVNFNGSELKGSKRVTQTNGYGDQTKAHFRVHNANDKDKSLDFIVRVLGTISMQQEQEE